MVGGQKRRPLAFSDFLVKGVKQALQFHVQPEVHVHGFLGMWPNPVADVVCGTEAQRQQVGDVVLPQICSVNGRQGKVHDQGIATGGAFEEVVAAVLGSQSLQVVGEGGLQLPLECPLVRVVVGQTLSVDRFVVEPVPSRGHEFLCAAGLVEVHQPQGKGVAVVRARDEVSEVFAVEPKRPICGVTGRKNRPAVFHADAVHLGLAARGHFQFVTQRGGQHAVGGHLA